MPGNEVIGKEEFNQIKEVFDNGGVLFRHGFDDIRNNSYKTLEFEKKFAKEMNVNYALAVSSGTAALRVALASLGIGRGDEVITQSFTFVATVEAIIESQATPVCADIDDTLNLDPESFRSSITKKTKAVIVVHMLGAPARIDKIKKICREENIFLIEDTAWGCGGSLNGTKLGTWGDIGTYSFDFAKTITTGEGGMIVFKNKKTYQKAAAWHDHGHENNPSVPRWEDTRSSSGFNYRMNELQGAVGIAQLKKLSNVVNAQRENRDLIWSKISDLSGIEPRKIISGAFDTADALVFLVKSPLIAKKCRNNLIECGLSTKILPEAYSWHFAGTWNHMPELVERHGGNLNTKFSKSIEFLKRAVAIPIKVKQPNENELISIRDAIEKSIT